MLKQLEFPRPVWLLTVRQALTYRRTRIGLLVTLLVLAFAFISPFLAPNDPGAFVGKPFELPGAAHLLGTDSRGRDVLSRLMSGGVTVVWMSIASAVIGMLLGVTIGLVAAYAKGPVAEALMRGMDVFLAIPATIFVLLMVSLIGVSNGLLVVLIGISHMPQVARVSRAVASEVVTRDFIAYAEALAVPRWRILLREVLPNVMTPLMVEFGIRIVWSIGTIAALSVIGYGIQPPAADWGLMINENRGRLATRPLPVLAPAILIGLFAFGVNMITEGFAGTVSGVSRKLGLKNRRLAR
jgi:peptide/nickel transport system permease protein